MPPGTWRKVEAGRSCPTDQEVLVPAEWAACPGPKKEGTPPKTSRPSAPPFVHPGSAARKGAVWRMGCPVDPH